jgi:hypothetical protein
MHNLMKVVAFAVLNLMTLPAWATPFSATIPDAIGPIYGSGGPLSYVIGSVTSPGQSADGAATLTFDLIGYGGIDGPGGRINTNDVPDNFSFLTGDPSLNGVSFNISLNMGGAHPGSPTSLASYPGVTLVSYTDNGPGLGGLAQFRVAFTLLTGDNGFIFQYSCCSPFNETEEGWGLRNVLITADLPTAAVPEPETYALLLAGLGMLGFTARRRKQSEA